jgi:hypothetical protein
MTKRLNGMLWGRNNPLFFYGNEKKLDDLLARAYGEVVTQLQIAEKEGGKATLKFAAKFGGVLAALGLAEASSELGSEFSFEDAKTKIASITFETKLDALTTYCATHEEFPYVDAARGLILKRDHHTPVEDWIGRPIEHIDRIDRIEQMVGLFSVERVLPPHDVSASIAHDFQEQKANLWLFKSLPEAQLTAEVPILLSNTRLTSQHAILAFARSSQDYFKIETVGLLTWNGNCITCDPIAWRLFY